jgi:predicted O-linked N-acetylglucosamine transferase (SPINDLY family)
MDIKILVGNLSLPALLASAANIDVQDTTRLLTLYQIWLAANPGHVQAYVVYFNLGVIYAQLKQDDLAIKHYQLSLATKSDLHEARLNLGTCFERLGDLGQALAHWQVVLDATKLSAVDASDMSYRVLALNNLGRIREGLKDYAVAEGYYAESLTLQPEQPNVIQHWVYARQRQCSWPVYSGLDHILTATKLAYSGQLALLALTDDPMRQLRAAHDFLQRKNPQGDIRPLSDPSLRYGHDRLRIAYLSSDIANHPVSLLTVPLFELCDKAQFEVYLFSWGHKDSSEVRQRILSAVDHHIDANTLSDEALAHAIKAAEIDMIIDLNGLTSGARPNVFYYRPAPIQITYLGFPGPYGHPYIDYVMVDKYLMPEALVPYFAEKPLYLPRVFQLSDDRRLVGTKPIRAEHGLPATGVILAAFNNNYKFTPEVFVVWMRILKAVPDAVLWLLADNPMAQENMLNFAACHHVAPERLIFAGRVSPADYLARYQLVDLFLDTFPFNAGTTANDALYMGTPVLTLAGKSFAARMAAALLHALDMDELITESLVDYEAKAVDFAGDTKMLTALRLKLQYQKEKTQVFNSQQQVRDIEAAYLSLLAQ